MKRDEIQIGGRYFAKISGRMTIVRIQLDKGMHNHLLGRQHHYGWLATNEQTGRQVHIRSAAKLRKSAEGFEYQRGKLCKLDPLVGSHPAEVPADARD